MKKFISWILVLYIVFVFIQSLFFKFAGSLETAIMFDTIGTWMAGVSVLASVAPAVKIYGGYAVGSAELIVSVLLLIQGTRKFGAVLALLITSSALFFHLATPLGVNRIIDLAGNTDSGVLFFMACGVWLSSLILLLLSRRPKSIYR